MDRDDITVFKSYSLGDNIRRARNFKDMSQEDLATKVGLSRTALVKIEHSDEVDPGKLERIAEVLGMTPDEIRNFPSDIRGIQIQTMNDNSQAIYQTNIHQTEKITELYERLLQAEKDKNRLLLELLNKKQD